MKIENTKSSKYGRVEYRGYDSAFFEYPKRIVFITLTSSGKKKEGDPFAGYFLSEELALDALDKEIQTWITNKPGAIHWRLEPTTSYENFFRVEGTTLVPIKLWYAFCRIAVDEYIPRIEKEYENKC